MSQDSSLRDDHERAPDQHDEQQWIPLPPTDKGPAAWKCLAGCCLVEGILWGLPLTFGVFQKHYFQHELFKGDSAVIPTIGTLSAAMCYFGTPMILPLTRMYPRYLVHFVWTGWALCIISLMIASLATRAWHLAISQGFLYGLSWALCSTPFLFILNQWFVKKRGTAYGIVFSSSGVFAMILPFCLEASLQRYGFRSTLRLTAVSSLLLTAPAFFLIRPRIKGYRSQNGRSAARLHTILSPRTCVFYLAIFLQGIGWFLPRFFLPTFAHDLSLSHTQGASLLAFLGFAQMSGQLILGWVSDKVNIYIPMTVSTLLSAAATLLLWGPAKGMLRLSLFSLFYGSFGGGFTVLWARMAIHCTTNELDIITIYSIFSVMRGVGNVVSGPLSSLLLSDSLDVSSYGLEKYKGIVGFVCTAMTSSAACGIAYFFSKEASGTNVATEKQDEETPDSDVYLLSDHGA